MREEEKKEKEAGEEREGGIGTEGSDEETDELLKELEKEMQD